jgi:hypothetical protein
MKAKKNRRQRSEQIQQVSAGLRDLLGISQWRKEHPQATWAEIEAAIDEHINQIRAQLLEDVVQMGESDPWSELPEEERPRCATCSKPLVARGKQTRYLQTNGGEAVKLTRTYGTCPACGVGFFPLDELLELLGGGLTPRGEGTLTRLSTWMPSECARELLQDVLGMRVSKATARRATLSTGQAALAVWDEEVERLKQDAPEVPAGAGEGEKQALSADGAMGHLVGGEWGEVKTLAIGEVTRNRRGEVCTQHLSYCSRLCDAASFEQTTLLETHRRGLSRASEVCAVQDGAEWLQGLVDYHRADAVRMLDFAHAAEYINDIGQAVQAAGGRLAHWLRQRGKCQQAGRRSTPQRGRYALGATERQPDVGVAQCRLQSRVAAHLGDVAASATSAAYEAEARHESATAGVCLLGPRRVGSTALSAASSPCCPGPRSDG